MKLSTCLIKSLLAYVEETSEADGRVLDVPEFPQFSKSQVTYHIDLCAQAGYMEVQPTSDVSYPRELTWLGHQELKRLRQEKCEH